MSRSGRLDDLIRALDSEDPEEARTALNKLTAVLAAITGGESLILRSSSLSGLYRAIDFGARFQWPVFRDEPFVMAILHALKWLGDPRAIPHVRALAANAREERLRQAADECLAVLKRRFPPGTKPNQMLRAAQQPEDQERLLRSSSVDDVAPELLPRPASPEGPRGT
jgi:hypothetical protein